MYIKHNDGGCGRSLSCSYRMNTQRRQRSRGDEARSPSTGEPQSLPDLPTELVDKIMSCLSLDQAAGLRAVNTEWRDAFFRHPWWTRGLVEGPRARQAVAAGLNLHGLNFRDLMCHENVMRAQLADWVEKEIKLGSRDAANRAKNILSDVVNKRKQGERNYSHDAFFVGVDIHTLPACCLWIEAIHGHIIVDSCPNLSKLWPVSCDNHFSTTVSIRNAPNLRELPADLGRMKSLAFIEVAGNTGITSLPPGLEALPLLRQIRLTPKPEFSCLPGQIGRARVDWLEEVPAADTLWNYPAYVRTEKTDTLRRDALARHAVLPDVDYRPVFRETDTVARVDVEKQLDFLRLNSNSPLASVVAPNGPLY